MALRKTKKSETMVNIRPMIHELSADQGNGSDKVVLLARVSFVESATLKPDLLLQSLCEYAGAQLPKHEIRRIRLLGLVDDQPVALIDM